ncbi:hypothetical protein KR044_011713, partial [Drosophila immigrans]
SSQLIISNSDYDVGFVIEFAKLLVVKHRFETLITYAVNRKSELPSGHQLVDGDGSLERRLIQQLQLPIIVWGLSSNVTFWHIITHKTLVLATIEHYSPTLVPLLEVLHKTLSGRHNAYILFIMRQKSPTKQQLKEFFTWCWSRNLVNVALTFRQVHNQLFTYTPFPNVRVINVTSFGVDYEWPSFSTRDVKGYEFRIPVFQDPPASYLLTNGQLKGVTGSLVSSYINHINGRLKVERLQFVDRSNYYNHTLLATARNEIDFGVHPISTLELNSNKTNVVYSYTLTKTCLMVPWIRDSTLRIYFRSVSWINYILLLIVSLVALGWWLYDRQVDKGLYLGVCAYFSQPLNSSSFERLPRTYKIIHLSILMCILIIRNMKSGQLFSSFSVQQMIPQINSIDDFVDSSLRLMITETEYKMYFETDLLPAELKDRLLVVNRSTLLKHRDNLNTSFAYLATTSYANILTLQQNFLQRPLFRVVGGTQLCTASYFVGLPIQWNSPFKRHLFSFYLKSLRNGFHGKWLRSTNMFLFQIGVFKAPRDGDLPFASLAFRDFDVLFRNFGVGMLCCLLSLLIEILYNRLTL